MGQREDRPGEEWRQRPSVVRQGARFGAIGCMGFATFVVLFVIAVIVALLLLAHALRH